MMHFLKQNLANSFKGHKLLFDFLFYSTKAVVCIVFTVIVSCDLILDIFCALSNSLLLPNILCETKT